MQQLQTPIPKVVNLNEFPAPDLAIEVGDTSLSDDLNGKKQLYEQVQVSEYWVVNVAKAKLSAFAIIEGKSQPITESLVLPGLEMSLLEQVLRRSWSGNQTEVGAYGYIVQLGKGTKDGGADIIATKEIENIGFIKGIWQAKKPKPGKKVGIGVIRELADTRREMKANKGIIVTSTFLTKGAIERVKRDNYELGKVENPDLESWINRVLKGR